MGPTGEGGGLSSLRSSKRQLGDFVREGATGGGGLKGVRFEGTRTVSLVVVSGVPSDWEWAGIKGGWGTPGMEEFQIPSLEGRHAWGIDWVLSHKLNFFDNIID